MTSRSILSVSDFTRVIRESLEDRFRDVWIEGEVSNVRMPGSGHVYFTLKDERSQVRMVLFRTGFQYLRFALKEGLRVVTRGRVTVYDARGEYQVVVEYIEPRGIGSLQLAFEQLKERLAREGLFLQSRKRALPRFPEAVGVVTSLTGAAIRDVVTVLCRRWPAVHIVIAPVPVQGVGAAERIASAIESLADSKLVDVIIVGRGGGSWEDLWSFNEEVVVRAIAGARVPVVSAVGHEVDVTLADFAADHRAPTPSAAAEAVVPVREEVMTCIAQWSIRMIRGMRGHCVAEGHRLQHALRVCDVMRRRVYEQAQRLDDLVGRMVGHMRRRLGLAERAARELHHGLIQTGPSAALREFRVLLPQLFGRLERQMGRILSDRRQALHGHISQLDVLSPLGTLSRGYSVIQRVSDNRLVRQSSDVTEGDLIRARLAQGRLLCLVKQTLSDSSP
ncbi:MAG TPA: exodeoxyribonuclease VII large subunit [Nitrospiraceae bacterium]|nr:exodeoxyribonuclease VII large subunit [Nitrospiraceae bacterium]